MRLFHSSKPMNEILTVRDTIRIAMLDEMRRDERVFLMGLDVGEYDGAYKVSKGMYAEMGPLRVWDTPISEAGCTGLSVGAGLMGLRPIVEVMAWTFAL